MQRRSSRSIEAGLAISLAAMMLAQGFASASPATLGVAASEAAARTAEAAARVERARALVPGSLTSAFLAVAELGRLTPRHSPPAFAAVPATVPAAIAAPVARIVGALEAASATGLAAVTPDARALFDETTTILSGVRSGDDIAEGLAPLRARMERAVDHDRLATAGITVTRALDEAMPALRSFAEALPRSTAIVAGCDVVDAAPVLCIGNTGANTYTTDYALLVDLGGDDVHANGAGAGLPFTNSLAAAVTLDLDGDDLYTATFPRLSTNLGAHSAQGVGWFGGTGMLVDVEGNDRYAIQTGPKPSNYAEFSPWPAYGQAYAAAGVGVLADLAGDDRFEMTNRAQVEHAPVYGRAHSGNGITLFLDRAGNDTHLAASEPQAFVDKQGRAHSGHGSVAAFGYGSVGTALFVDEAGDDTMTVSAIGGSLDPGTTGTYYYGTGTATSLGYGALGHGAVMLGPGRQNISVDVGATGPRAGLGLALTYGVGSLGGVGVLRDDGGDDVYEVRATARDVRDLSIDDRCACAGVVADDPYSQSAEVQAHGLALPGGVGLLVERGGDDVYRSTAVSDTVVRLHDRRTRAFPPPTSEDPSSVVAVASDNLARVLGQGHSRSGVVSVAGQVSGAIHGAATLVDHAGDDSYVADARATTDVFVSSDLQATTTVTAGGVRSLVHGQGAATGVVLGTIGSGSYGRLTDRAGSDTYSSAADRSVSLTPAPSAPAAGDATTSVQGSVTDYSVAFLEDLGGEPDTFSATPADPTCTGTRGSDVWIDCGTLSGIGRNE